MIERVYANDRDYRAEAYLTNSQSFGKKELLRLRKGVPDVTYQIRNVKSYGTGSAVLALLCILFIVLAFTLTPAFAILAMLSAIPAVAIFYAEIIESGDLKAVLQARKIAKVKLQTTIVELDDIRWEMLRASMTNDKYEWLYKKLTKNNTSELLQDIQKILTSYVTRTAKLAELHNRTDPKPLPEYKERLRDEIRRHAEHTAELIDITAKISKERAQQRQLEEIQQAELEAVQKQINDDMARQALIPEIEMAIADARIVD